MTQFEYPPPPPTHTHTHMHVSAVMHACVHTHTHTPTHTIHMAHAYTEITTCGTDFNSNNTSEKNKLWYQGKSLVSWWSACVSCGQQIRSVLSFDINTVWVLRLNRIPYIAVRWWWLLLYSAVLCFWADSLRMHVILHEWLAIYSAFLNIHQSGVLYSAGMAGATWNCCGLSAFYVHHTTMHHAASCKATCVRCMHV